MILQYLIYAFDGYLIGSVPTAYLLVRWKTGGDIRTAGSTKVGAFNAYDTTKSRALGIAVGLLDALKGFTVAVLVGPVLGGGFWLQACAVLGVLIGHCYPVWLRFKGGRGLASLAGAMLAIGLSYPLLWCLVWYAVYRATKKILAANLAAILISPILLLIVPAGVIDWSMVRGAAAADYRLFAFLTSVIFLTSHRDELQRYFVSR